MIAKIVIFLRHILPGIETHNERETWRREMTAELVASQRVTGDFADDFDVPPVWRHGPRKGGD